MGFFTNTINWLSEGYTNLVSGLSPEYFNLLNVFIFAILIALYSMFTWRFYRYLSKKDLINLNLQQYNKTNHPFWTKIVASLLYLLEYIVILPVLIFFWFAVLALIILILSENLAAIQIITLSAAMVAAIRMLSYYEEDLSKDLAKIFPFTFLAIFIINPGFFSLERVLSNLAEIPSFLSSIVLFLVLIIVVEIVLRFSEVVIDLFKSEKENKIED